MMTELEENEVTMRQSVYFRKKDVELRKKFDDLIPYGETFNSIVISLIREHVEGKIFVDAARFNARVKELFTEAVKLMVSGDTKKAAIYLRDHLNEFYVKEA